MIAVLSHRLEGSKLDDLTLGAEVIELLLNLPEFRDRADLVPFMGGVLDATENAERLVAHLLPQAAFSVLPVFGRQFFVGMIDATNGRDLPFVATGPSRPRALLAACFRAYDHVSSLRPQIDLVADRSHALAFRSRVAGATE